MSKSQTYNQWETQSRDFQEKGFFTAKGLFDREEVAMWQLECDRLWDLNTQQNTQESNLLSHRVGIDQKMKFDRLDPATKDSPLFEKLSRNDRILNLMENVLGGKPILFKSKLIFKKPGTRGYGLHQDFPYWNHMNIPADALVTLQINIDASCQENGALELLPGVHHSVLPAPADDPRDVDPSQVDFDSSELIEGGAGDVCIFHSLTPHRSNDNRSQFNRRMLFLTYTTAKYRDQCQSYYATILG